MKTLNAPDTISGKEDRAYAKIDGNNEVYSTQSGLKQMLRKVNLKSNRLEKE